MASWVDLNTLHNPSPGTRPPASWGDGVVSNLAMLGGAEVAGVLTSQTTTSTTDTNLATIGPAVTLDTGTSVLVILSAQVSNSGANACFMSVAVSGATTVAVNYDNVLLYTTGTAGAHVSSMGFFTGLTPGSNVFTCKYAVNAGTGTWLRRKIAVIPLT